MATPTSGQQAAQQNGTAKTGGKRKKVASAAGAARYHKPIGSEIGGPRDANHAAIQQDSGARKNYGDLINGDSAKQRQALDGMSPEDLNKLADIAFSFKSSDPKVVALRIAARNAQARRGIRVPVGQTQTKSSGVRTAAKVAVGSKGAARKGKAPAKKAAPAPANPGMKGRVRAMSNGVGPASQRLIELAAQTPQHTAKTGSFPIPDVNHLRKAVQAIGRAKPEHRPIIARHILTRAKALKAEHLVSDHIRHYARGHRQPGTVGMSRDESGEAIELAGKWKHGYIPLDATAMASKMKGGKGKPWWTGPGHSSGAKKALHGSPKSGSPGSSGKFTKMVKSGPAESKTRGAAVNKPNEVERAAGGVKARLAPYRQMSPAQLDAKEAELKKRGQTDASVANDLRYLRMVKDERATSSRDVAKAPTVTKPADTYTRGHAGAKDGFDRGHKVSYTLNGKKHTGRITRIENGSGATVRRDRGEGAHDLVDRKNLAHADTPEKQAHSAYLAAEKGSPEKAKYAAETKKHFDARAKQDIANSQQRLQKLGVDAHGNKVAKPAGARMSTKQSADDYQKQRAEILKKAAAIRGDEPAGKEKTSGMNLATGKTETRAVVRDHKGEVIGTNKTGAAKSAQTRRVNQQLGAFAPKSQPKVAAGEAKATPAAVQNGERYIQMHGTAGARQKVAQLEARGHLTAPERVQLAGLKAALAGGGSGKA
jgi:hypothetical protein